MSKSEIPKLILYSQKPNRCTCYDQIFNHHFETIITDSEGKLLDQAGAAGADAAVVCFCSAQEKDAEEFLRIESIAGPLPMLTCSETLHPDFVKRAAQLGIDRFLDCRMSPDKITDIIYEAISWGGLTKFLEMYRTGNLSASRYVQKMIREIVYIFPHRPDETEIAGKLGISQSYLQKLCRKAFDTTFSKLMRLVWIHQALRMMKHTNLDNTEIALQLNFSEESNMARDFRKELGYTPTKARKLLTDHTPEELLLK